MRLLIPAILLAAAILSAAPKPHQPAPPVPPARNALASRFQPFDLPDGTVLTLAVDNGKPFTIPLRENPTTGYSWQVEIGNPEAVAAVSSEYVQGGRPGMTGAPGMRLFTFKGNGHGGSSAIQFRYRRPWEKNTAPAKTLTVLVILQHGR
jgi:inhibitor of cysteine peptidase